MVNHNPCEYGKYGEYGEYDEAASDHDDSEYFCDSDSGISSLYETVRKQSDPQEFSEIEKVTQHILNKNLRVYQQKLTRDFGGTCTENFLNMLNIDVGFWYLYIRQRNYCSNFFHQV
jgi:hypothetical protein